MRGSAAVTQPGIIPIAQTVQVLVAGDIQKLLDNGMLTLTKVVYIHLGVGGF